MKSPNKTVQPSGLPPADLNRYARQEPDVPTILDAFNLATERGYLPVGPKTRWLSEEPPWLTSLQTPAGFAALEFTLRYQVPTTVRAFWELPQLVRLLDSWRWQDYLACPPDIVFWGSKPNLVICTHPHSGGIGAVLLDNSDDPPLSWGFAEDDEPIEWRDVSMSQHVFVSVQQGPD